MNALPAAAQSRCEHPVARIVSAEGEITIAPAPGGAQRIAVRPDDQTLLCAGDSLQVGRRSRAAMLLLDTDQLVRLDQNTTVRVLAPQKETGRSLLDLFQGLIRLFSPVGRPLDVKTPYVTAGVEGTEFWVAYDKTSADARVGVVDGRVSVARESELAKLGAGEAILVPRSGPPRRIELRPADGVLWTIFYPPAMWSLPDAEAARLDPRVAAAWRAWRSGDEAEFIRALDAVPAQDKLDPASLVRLSALLLSVGRADEASAALDRAEAKGSRSPLIPSERAVIAVAQNRTTDALTFSANAADAAATAGDPTAAAGAAVARSYALQSARQLEAARAALSAAPGDDPLVLARLAEIELSLGNVRAARDAARRAIAAAPHLSRPYSILGFAALADFDFAGGRTAFEEARVRDPGDPLPRIGLGLAAIRAGDIAAGRRELAIAVALDPLDAVARSYLGKAYAAEYQFDAAFREWDLAEKADPRDPTPPLYRAFVERSLNRPTEALTDIEKSIELNDQRAVYRSQLLLDQDLATRTADRASIYRDLGFEQLALSEGFNSVNIDPANAGAHRFLSDTYLSLPRHETASDSELLQSLLLQPLIVGPVQPRLSREGLGILDLRGPAHTGFSEFSPLFASNGVNLLADGFAGNFDTFGDNLVASGIYDNYSFSAGQFAFRTAGIRDNNRLNRNIQDIFFQPALSDQASLLAEFRHSDLGAGDTNLFFDPNNFGPNARQTSNLQQFRFGGRYDVMPGITVVGVYTHEHLTGLNDTGAGIALNDVTDGDFGEAAAYISGDWYNVVAGFGIFNGNDDTTANVFGMQFPAAFTNIQHNNGWIYANVNPIRNLRLTLGGSYDDFRSTIVSRDRFNPKLGAAWEPLPGTMLRAAYFQTMKRTTVGGQTIEPTQIAGFNQLYDDISATLARRWGVGVDQRLCERLYAGAEWSQRQLVVPVVIVGPPNTTIEQGWKERFGRVYLNWVPVERVAVNLEAQWERLVRDPTASNDGEFADLSLLRIPLEVRYFDPSGLFGLVRASFIRESGNFLDANFNLFGGKSSFATVDAGLGWRLPGRQAIGTIEVDNLFDQRFRFQDTDPTNPRVVPRLQVLARITLGF